jgi:uncharacterized protein with HEPN domain
VASDLEYLVYARDSIERLVRWTEPGRDTVLGDEVLFEAVLRRLETLADAVSQLSEPVKQRHPEIPWRSVVDFRNRLAHGYLTVNPDRVWDVVEIDLPLLKAVVDKELDASP